MGVRVAWIDLSQELIIFDGLLELTGDVFVVTHDNDEPFAFARACPQFECLGEIFACLARFAQVVMRHREAFISGREIRVQLDGALEEGDGFGVVLPGFDEPERVDLQGIE